MEMANEDQNALSYLIARNREGQLDNTGHAKLGYLDADVSARTGAQSLDMEGRGGPWLEGHTPVTLWRASPSPL
jgi:hypothetical protein